MAKMTLRRGARNQFLRPRELAVLSMITGRRTGIALTSAYGSPRVKNTLSIGCAKLIMTVASNGDRGCSFSKDGSLQCSHRAPRGKMVRLQGARSALDRGAQKVVPANDC
jgi:hypothetical protein